MQEIFQTFKPKNSIVKKYVDYYYLDIKPNNSTHEFQCFPHFNNTISIYKSHVRLENGEMKFDENAKPFQIFTPIREKVLNVKQLGKVHRIVVVFQPLGIQQFYKNLNFSDYITDFDFFNSNELQEILSTIETEIITSLLDNFLENRFKKFENPILEKSIHYISNHYEDFSVAKISEKIGISRQHLNRVFQLNLGVSIKKFHEIVLFRQSVNKKLFENPNSNFTALAYEFNFSDQSHFNKTYKTLVENSPKFFFDKGTILGKEDTFWHLKS
ncbi:AraC family transcriptional regulator [Chryseobacterium sp. Ch-15]|uniref:AraC family transcriptional regulator n=1 Tax=Chryseobacterium muglaense TaxID=2893752 RepID=A0A9Q3UWI2_9FLAO|nr:MULTISPECIES: AraC family transcriptional regulator [Chryseobacterium]MBD3906991.1 helix-turn-helix transcriptional regulator [Chryseobacterium muglaense]MBO6185104.1 helix-turn-helix transcriptional regulator [Chryseobacterium sp.]MCC9036394.1 AraC family transcriptional regulator [Chryseobacterium muglaense]MCM2556706.1 AraC family transcriptional regulator [Chryseobacterium muglaense]